MNEKVTGWEGRSFGPLIVVAQVPSRNQGHTRYAVTRNEWEGRTLEMDAHNLTRSKGAMVHSLTWLDGVTRLGECLACGIVPVRLNPVSCYVTALGAKVVYPNQVFDLLVAQGGMDAWLTPGLPAGKCAFPGCEDPLVFGAGGPNKSTNLDHCGKTRLVRGWLCPFHNQGMKLVDSGVTADEYIEAMQYSKVGYDTGSIRDAAKWQSFMAQLRNRNGLGELN